MDNFTPVSALLGGLVIGTAAALLLIFNGKISGVSGFSEAYSSAIIGMCLGELRFCSGRYHRSNGLRRIMEICLLSRSRALLDCSWQPGLLVGFGTRLGAGWSSGHGVCGIGRASPRLLVATAIFLTVAAATVFITRHIGG